MAAAVGERPSTRTLFPSAYFSPLEIVKLREELGGSSRTVAADNSSRDVRRRLQACGFIQSLASLIGFPQRTAATAQLLYIRFHLFWSPADFAVHEVAIACLALSAKLNDTIKKSHEILLASYSLRYPDLAKSAQARAKPAAEGDGQVPSSGTGSLAFALPMVAETDIDASMLEMEKKRLLSLERLLLECIGFEFDLALRSLEGLRLVIKMGKKWRLERETTHLAWAIAADSHRTHMPLQYPSSTIAIASLYLAALLIDSGRPSRPQGASSAAPEMKDGFARVLGKMRPSTEADEIEHFTWRQELLVHMEDVEETVHAMLDLYAAACSLLPSTALQSATATPISPATPTSPAEPMSNDGDVSNGASSGRKLPAHAFSAPPLAVLAWLELLQRQMSIPSFPASGSGGVLSNHDEALPTPSELISELTQIKIGLRKVEDERRASDLALLATAGTAGSQSTSAVATTASMVTTPADIERPAAQSTGWKRLSPPTSATQAGVAAALPSAQSQEPSHPEPKTSEWLAQQRLADARRRRELVVLASAMRRLDKGGVSADAGPGDEATAAATATTAPAKPSATRFLF